MKPSQRRNVLTVLLWASLLRPVSGAAEEGIQPVSLEQLVQEARDNNPGIQAARRR